ncbi:Tubulin monoglycylase TTLL3 [Liparis tanakae]|uniref:Tubulin monoglycylase TTLL3 n=1 Tax=Liparis tanakae TaxID=230148 RepID=A0A4Z2FHI3_9TELE|nr:Tubulin monoglycylase TTLL3 [Liparis tanakae]
MRADVSMEATRSDQLGHEGQGATNRCKAPRRDSVRLRKARALVEEVVRMHKVFSVQGPYPVVRAALKARGWVEQRAPRPDHTAHRRHSDNLEKEPNRDGLYDLMCRLVQNETVYFHWTNRRDAVNTNSLQKGQMTNHFAKAGSFTTKVGLCVNLRNLHWFDSADPDTFFPRCYRLGAKDEKPAFIEDYRRTACTSFLKYIVEREQGAPGEGTGHNSPSLRKRSKLQPSPVVLSQMINSALKVCHQYLESLEHRDIDIHLETPQTPTEPEWAQFISDYYLVVHKGAEIENSENFVSCCKAMLQRVAQVSPQLDIDGIQNIWIIKPGAMSRGRGIKCARHLDQILSLVDGDPTLRKESKWVVQKYLERPLLVHGTKFDVRQWFLVTVLNPLTVWFYTKCYLRFSTQPYSLDTLDSSVHLCNNSIQKHLTPSQQRHPGIPADNMWSDDQFRTFLSLQGREAQWQAVAVPAMKKAEDTLRVVLDHRADHNASTGDFQLIYRQEAVDVPQYVGVNLLVEGNNVRRPFSLPPLHPSVRSAAKCSIKEKEPRAEKVKTLPKMLLKRPQTQLKPISRGVALPLPPDLPQTANPVEAVSLHLPMTVTSIHPPNSAKSPPVLLWKRQPKVSEEVQPLRI